MLQKILTYLIILTALAVFALGGFEYGNARRPMVITCTTTKTNFTCEVK